MDPKAEREAHEQRKRARRNKKLAEIKDSTDKDALIAKLFKKFDSDNSGTITVKELGKAAKTWGVKLEKANREYLMNKHGDGGALKEKEFGELMMFFLQMRRAFLAHDADNSGTIDKRELSAIMKSFDQRYPPAVISSLVEFFDDDDSGGFTFDEFMSLMLHVNELEHQFTKNDQDNSQLLDPAELQDVLRAMDIKVSVPEVKTFMKRHSDGNDGLTFEGLVALMVELKNDREAIEKETRKEREKERKAYFAAHKDAMKKNTRRTIKMDTGKQFVEVRKEAEKIAKAIKSEVGSGKWVDPDFGTEAKDVFPSKPSRASKITQWLRPSEISADFELFVDGIDEGDVCQGALGDCWFLSAMSVFAVSGNEQIQNLFVGRYPEQGFYQLRFYKEHKWRVITIDDRIPCNAQGKPVFARCKDLNEMWVPLIEKAYAKLHGSFEAIESGIPTEGLVDVTGEASETGHDIKASTEMWNKLIDNMNQSFLMGCSSVRKGGTDKAEDASSSGILQNHAYGILLVEEFQGKKLVRVRNPWGRFEWKGRWSDGSKEWQKHPEIGKHFNYVDADDGTFFMEWKDFCKEFNRLYTVRLMTDTVGEAWHRADVSGEWKGPAAGGCINNPTWNKNPQFKVTFSKPNQKVFLSLQQPDLRMKLGQQPTYKPCGFLVFKKDPEENVPTMTALQKNLLSSPMFVPGRENSAEFDTGDASSIVVVPCMFEKGLESSFFLSVYAHEKVSLEVLESAAPNEGDLIKGEWSGPSASGCPNFGGWRDAPQYILDVSKQTNVSVLLEQAGTPLHAGIYIVEGEPSKRRALKLGKVVHQPQYTNTSPVAASVKLPAGSYNVIATAYHAGKSNTFTIGAAGDGVKMTEISQDWETSRVSGAWTKETAGGCRNHPTFKNNPKHSLSLSGQTSFTVCLFTSAEAQKAPPIGAFVYEKQGSDLGKCVGQTPLARATSVTGEVSLGAGEYYIVPCTFEPNVLSDYQIVVYSDNATTLS